MPTDRAADAARAFVARGLAYVALVDDDATLYPVMQAVVDDVFGGKLTVRHWLSGRAAVNDLIEGQPPELIVLDIRLPDVDGVTILRRIKSDARLRRVPVLMLSANSNWTMVQVAMDAGADGYLFKPFEYETLAGWLRDLGATRLGRGPAPAPAPAAAPSEPAEAGAPAALAVEPVAAAPPRRRLLIVEDNRDILSLLAALFADPRIELEVAENVVEASQKAWAWRPDVILLDVLLPGESGLDLLLELRRARAFEPKIIMMSAHLGPRAFALAKRLGAHACFEKPFPPEFRGTVLGALGVPAPA